MLKHIINKLVILLIINLTLITSCKKEKNCDVYDLVQRIYGGENFSILNNVINFKIDKFSPLNDGIVCGGAFLLNNQSDCLWFFSNENNYNQGMIITLVYTSIKGKKWDKTQEYYLKDCIFIPGFSEKKIQYGNVSYGEPRFGQAYIKHYNKEGAGEIEYVGEPSISYDVDENIYGIYAYEGKYPPYNKKVKPKYLVYVENEKLVVEEPKDDKYFIYRIPEL